jgi:hypothetical protein
LPCQRPVCPEPHHASYAPDPQPRRRACLTYPPPPCAEHSPLAPGPCHCPYRGAREACLPRRGVPRASEAQGRLPPCYPSSRCHNVMAGHNEEEAHRVVARLEDELGMHDEDESISLRERGATLPSTSSPSCTRRTQSTTTLLLAHVLCIARKSARLSLGNAALSRSVHHIISRFWRPSSAVSPLSEGRCVPQSYAIGKINTCSESAAQALQEYVTFMDRAYIAWMKVSAHD